MERNQARYSDLHAQSRDALTKEEKLQKEQLSEEFKSSLWYNQQGMSITRSDGVSQVGV